MEIRQTTLPEVLVIYPTLHKDGRGGFQKLYCSEHFYEKNIKVQINQVNVSLNDLRGTLRGMHYQSHPHEEEKIVKCIKGSIYDVVIDIRQNSPTFGQWISEKLTQENNKMLFIPKGYAHGFLTLENYTEVLYLMSGHFNPEAAKGLRWNDPTLSIEWPFEPKVINDKDTQWPLIKK